MNDQDEQGTIETRSGNWEWEVRNLRPWPKSDVTGKRLGFKDRIFTVGLELERHGVHRIDAK